MSAKDRTDELFGVLHYLKRARDLIPEIPGVPQGEFMMMHKIHCCLQEGECRGEQPGVKVSKLSARLGMSMPAVSQMLKSPHGRHGRPPRGVCGAYPGGGKNLFRCDQPLFGTRERGGGAVWGRKNPADYRFAGGFGPRRGARAQGPARKILAYFPGRVWTAVTFSAILLKEKRTNNSTEQAHFERSGIFKVCFF